MKRCGISLCVLIGLVVLCVVSQVLLYRESSAFAALTVSVEEAVQAGDSAEALRRLEREQRDAAAMGSQNRAWVQAFAQYENVQELDRRLLMALVDKIFIYEDKRVEIAFRYRDEFARAMEVAKNYQGKPLPAAV